MLQRLIVNVLLVNFLLMWDAEGLLLDRFRGRSQAGINLSSGSKQCETMLFSLPKPETGCCGVHKFDEPAFSAGKRIYKRNVQDEESDGDVGDDDSDISDDEYYYQYEYDSSDLKNDTLPGLRKKRTIIDSFQNPPNEFIVGGGNTDISHYPWMVHLEIVLRGQRFDICGGSLINSKYVLTARHCMQREFNSLDDIRVVLAEYDTRTQPMDCEMVMGNQRCVNNVVMNPEQIIMHPQGHDIAMLRLKGQAPYSEFIRPICLPPFNIDTPQNRDLELLVAGWGSVYQGSPGYPIKRSVTVNLVPLEECRRVSPVPSEMLCAIGHHGQDACHGDSGGPLMAYYKGNYFLVGIVSGKYIEARCGSRVPTAYVNVHLYLDWIRSVMTPR